MEFKQFIGIIKAKWWFIAAVALFLTSAVGVYSYGYTQPVYEASAKLMLTNEQVEGGVINYNTLMANSMLLQTYGDIARTPRLLDKVVHDHPELGMTLSDLIAAVGSRTSDNQIMSIVVRDPSYQRAANIANTVAGVMVKEIPAIMKMNNVFLLDKAPAVPHPVPVNLKPEIKTLIAFILSSMLGIGIVLLREYMDDRIRSARDIERTLGIEALAAMPRMKKVEAYPLIRAEPEDTTAEKAHIAVSQ
jgi:capsular polysaccharide biosynthesis protein